MTSRVDPVGEAYVAESWGQPPVGLLFAVRSGNQVYWQRLSGIQYCSSSVATVLPVCPREADLEAWDSLSDEALINFETEL